MAKVVGWKIVETVFWALFALAFAILCLAVGLSSWNVLFLVIGIIAVAILIFWVCTNISDIKRMKKMYPLGQKLEDYLETNGYRYIYFGYPGVDNAPPTNPKTSQWLIIYDPYPQIIGFKKTVSPIPERYDFFLSDNDQKYLYIRDTYRDTSKLLKKQ